MRKMELDIYKFEDLTKEQQDKVIKDYMKDDSLLDEETLNIILIMYLDNELKKKRIKEIKNKKLYYSLGYSQGDGVCFIGTFRWNDFNVYIKHTGRYYHNNSVEIDLESEEPKEPDETDHREFRNIYKDICNELEKLGYKFIEETYSEENIKEMIISNDYEFYIQPVGVMKV